jgi:transcriptional regulator with XRE-family HTH domain
LEKLAYESEIGSKGFLSDIERGLALPSLTTLKIIADHLDVLLLDLVTFPERSDREKLTSRLRTVPPGTIRRLLRDLGPPPRRPPR